MSSRIPFWRKHSGRTTDRPGRPPITRYRVCLHRAVDKELMFVARAVMELTRFGSAEAEYRMWEAHHRGRSVVLVTHLERAELFVEQFADRGLAASIEPI